MLKELKQLEKRANYGNLDCGGKGRRNLKMKNVGNYLIWSSSLTFEFYFWDIAHGNKKVVKAKSMTCLENISFHIFYSFTNNLKISLAMSTNLFLNSKDLLLKYIWIFDIAKNFSIFTLIVNNICQTPGPIQ